MYYVIHQDQRFHFFHPSHSELPGMVSIHPWTSEFCGYYVIHKKFSRYCISHHDQVPSWSVSSVSTNFKILRHSTSSVLSLFMSSITKKGVQARRHPKYTVREFRILRHPSRSGFPIFCVIRHDQSFQVFQVLCHPLHTEFSSCCVRYPLSAIRWRSEFSSFWSATTIGELSDTASSIIFSFRHIKHRRPIMFRYDIFKLLWSKGIDSASLCSPELVFVNVYKAQESMTRNRLHQAWNRFLVSLVSLKSLKIRANSGPVRQPYSYSVPSPLDCSKIPALHDSYCITAAWHRYGKIIMLLKIKCMIKVKKYGTMCACRLDPLPIPLCNFKKFTIHMPVHGIVQIKVRKPWNPQCL